MLVGPHNVIHMPAAAGTEITHMPFQPGSGAMLPGPRLSAATGTPMTPRSVTTHTMAPTSILMGGNAATETSLQGRHFTEPIRARMGTTLGGQYSVGGAVGEFRGDAFKGTNGPPGMNGPQGPTFSRGGPAGGPTFMPHGQPSSNSPQTGGNASMGGGRGGGGGTGNSGGTVNSLGAGSGGLVGSPVGGRH
jgi:hypothetical protein